MQVVVSDYVAKIVSPFGMHAYIQQHFEYVKSRLHRCQMMCQHGNVPHIDFHPIYDNHNKLLIDLELCQ